MGANERMAFSRDIARASTERDKCLRELGLDKRDIADTWPTIEAGPSVGLAAAEPQNCVKNASDDDVAEATSIDVSTSHDVAGGT